MADWNSVRAELEVKKVVRTILDDVSGQVRFGRVLAIMGPSGSGKTTLLNIIAGQLMESKAISTFGNVRRQGNVSLVEQDDLFVASDTVQEALTFHAALRLSLPPTDATVTDRVAIILRQLNLFHVRDTQIGDDVTRGISGGERKRLSIACALVCSPSIICLDEPTTGLDSWMAAGVVKQLRAIADAGAAVALSIHQPRTQSLALVDDILLLTANGRVAYNGPRDDLAAHLARIGFPVPHDATTSEWAIDIVSVDTCSLAGEAASAARMAAVADAFEAVTATVALSSLSAPAASPARVTTAPHGPPPHEGTCPVAAFAPAPARDPHACPRWALGLRMLVARTYRAVRRDTKSNRVRMSSSLSTAALFAVIYYGLTGRADVTGLLQVAAVNNGMVAMQKTIRAFAAERALVRREMAAGMYSASAYVLSKLLAEVPWAALFPLVFALVLYPFTALTPTAAAGGRFAAAIVLEAITGSSLGLAVGAAAPTADAASAIGPFIMSMFIVFGGMFVRVGSVPWVLAWVPRVSTVKLAFHALMLNEYAGEKEAASGALAALSLEGGSYWEAMVWQVRVYVCRYLVRVSVCVYQRCAEGGVVPRAHQCTVWNL